MRNFVAISLLFISVSLFTMCEKFDNIRGSGERVDHVVEFSAFSKIVVSGSASVNVTYGETQQVIISAQENVYEVMDNHVKNGELNIGLKDRARIKSAKDIIVTIVTPSPITDFIIDGSGDLNISGMVQEHFNVEINGSGSIYSYDLEVKNVDIEISGSGSCKVRASETLHIEINGSGSVYYKGNPNITQSISGSGSVNSEN